MSLKICWKVKRVERLHIAYKTGTDIFNLASSNWTGLIYTCSSKGIYRFIFGNKVKFTGNWLTMHFLGIIHIQEELYSIFCFVFLVMSVKGLY